MSPTITTLILLWTVKAHLLHGATLYQIEPNGSSILVPGEPVIRMCRDRIGLENEEMFKIRSCVMCYYFLFPGDPILQLKFYPIVSLIYKNQSTIETRPPLYPDGENETVMAEVCRHKNPDECQRWRSCCVAGNLCCNRQQTNYLSTPKGYCPRTWDGYRCWDDTPPATTATLQCPSYIEHSLSTKMAAKICTVNGTWFMRLGNPWTDYTKCLDRETYIKVTYTGLGFSVLSIILLLPATLIFLCYRDLLKQHRVRLHINFFASLILSGAANIIWFVLVHHDVLTNPVTTQQTLSTNPVWCRVLSFFKVYLTGTNYFWMLCEGYYLYRLISNAFEPPKSLVPLYLAGWALPAIHSVAWGIIRGILNNEKCWAVSYGAVTWVVWAPNLFCLAVNVFFLTNIMRILLCQLHSHPHEPSNFRRALKAVFMLVPLFGLQIFLVMYRPPPSSPGSTAYEYITNIVQHSQGTFVSLIFCFFNGEVLHHLKNTFPCLRRCCGGRRNNRGYTSHTQVTSVDRSPSLSLRSSVKNSPRIGRLLMNGETELVEASRSRSSSNGSFYRTTKDTVKYAYKEGIKNAENDEYFENCNNGNGGIS